MTAEGGGNAMESPDGKTLYYQKERRRHGEAFEGWSGKAGPGFRPRSGTLPCENGIYYIVQAQSAVHLQELRFLKLASGKREC